MAVLRGLRGHGSDDKEEKLNEEMRLSVGIN